MKKTLFFAIFFLAFIPFSKAQTNTFTGAIDNNWSTGLNWSLGVLPTASHDVVVPTGRTLNINVAALTKSIQVQAGANVTLAADLTFTQASAIAATAIVNWNGGSLIGGSTLTNLGTMNFGAGGKSLVTGTTLANAGTINIQSDWMLSINNGILNNLPSGVIDFQMGGLNITSDSGTGSHLLNNAGLIKKTGGTGDSGITAELVNTGTISVEMGLFTLQNPNTKLNGGVYNIAANAQLRWFSTVNCSGTLTGNVAGGLYWSGNVNVPETAVLNFTGSGTVSWSNGVLKGGGILENRSNMVFSPDYPGTKTITEATTFLNTGTVTILTDWSLDIANGTFNNASSGVIDFQLSAQITGTGTGSHALNNAGLIKKTVGSGVASVMTDLNNTGTLWAKLGYLDLNDPQIVLNGGTYNVDAGAEMRWGSTINCSGILTGNVAGGLYWTGIFNVPGTAVLNFTGNGTVSWSNGILKGGGTLENRSQLVLSPNYFGNKTITELTTFLNTGTITVKTDWPLDIANGTLNNVATGVIDLQLSLQILGTGTGLHALNNAGLIKKSAGSGIASIMTDLNNTGTLWAQSGYLDLNDPQIVLNGGVYNTDAAAELRFTSTVNCNGVLTGNVLGSIQWIGELNVASAATFNFGGNHTLNWGNGILKGGGTLTNMGTLTLSSAYAGVKTITAATILTNAGLIDITNDWSLDISNGTLNNLASGTINMKIAHHIEASGSGTHLLNNAGLFRKTEGTGGGSFAGNFVNSGNFEILAGSFTFSNLNNTLTGLITGTEQIFLPAAPNFTNNGTIAPGGSPGTLTAFGNYTSTAATRLLVEINGTAAVTQYDQFFINGNAEMRGAVNVTLGFAPVVGNQFVIATTTGTITDFSMETTTTATFNGLQYRFSVAAQNSNKVVLTLDSILATEEFVSAGENIKLYPNPAAAQLMLQNQGGQNLDEGFIIDLSGRIVKRFSLKNAEITTVISLEGLQSGQYYMKLVSEKEQLVKPFVVR